MMNSPSNTTTSSTRTEWMADSFRLSFFAEQSRSWPAGLLERLVGRPADLEQSSKRGAILTTLEAVKLGLFQINAVAQSGRFDVHISAAPSSEAPDFIVQPASTYRSVLDDCSVAASELGPFVRLAVTASLIRPYTNKREAYLAVHERFPCLGVDAEESDDFFMQVNRRKLQNPALNRIERWSYGLFERIDIPMIGVVQGASVGRRLEGVKLDLDFNTVPLPGLSFNAENCKTTLQSLVHYLYEKLLAE